MDGNIIVKAPVPMIYTPQEVVWLFNEQLKTPTPSNKVVTLEGIYKQSKTGNYYGYYYDSLVAQNDNCEMTLVVPAALREKMKDGTLVQVSGVVLRRLRSNKCVIELQFQVTKYKVIEENIISEDEQKLMILQAEKSARGFKNVDGVLEAKLFRGEKPNICLLFARGTITDRDFNKGLEAAGSHINFVEENETFTQISQLRAKLSLLDRMGYDVIAIVRGGGSGIKEVFAMPELIESVVNLSTPFVTGVGHPGEKPFIAKVADKDLGTPSLLGVYFRDLVNRVIDQREKSKAVLVEQIKKQYEERITTSEKQNKDLNEKIVILTKESEANRKLHADQMKELQNKITELNKSAENAQKLYKDQIEAMQKQVKVYEEQAKNFNENITKMQCTNAALQKSLTEIKAQNAKDLAEAEALATKLKAQLKQVILYVALVVLIAVIIMLVMYKNKLPQLIGLSFFLVLSFEPSAV